MLCFSTAHVNPEEYRFRVKIVTMKHSFKVGLIAESGVHQRTCEAPDTTTWIGMVIQVWIAILFEMLYITIALSEISGTATYNYSDIHITCTPK